MNLIPHDNDAQKNISIVDFEHKSKGEIFSVHPFLILCIMQNEVLQEQLIYLSVIIATVNQ